MLSPCSVPLVRWFAPALSVAFPPVRASFRDAAPVGASTTFEIAVSAARAGARIAPGSNAVTFPRNSTTAVTPAAIDFFTPVSQGLADFGSTLGWLA
jgi:hypothetical protein